MEPVSYLRFALALLVVLGLLALLAWALRRFGPGAGLTARLGRARRLSLIEVLPLDSRHRLALVRRDGKEHLLLLGAQDSLVVESGIAAPADPPASRPAGATEPKTDA
ncbi:MAG: flagellar biosynthetic protein FliO [Alphaproteobacteria bacterium]|nr:flagellar biosynthetic protein FliO [Alphaproteobacteria bacterium]